MATLVRSDDNLWGIKKKIQCIASYSELFADYVEFVGCKSSLFEYPKTNAINVQ